MEPFAFDSVSGTPSGAVWTAGGNGSLGVQLRTKISKVIGTHTSKDFHAVFFVDELYGWVVGESGTVFNSTDGGANWTRQRTKVDNDLRSVHCVTRQNCWIVGDSGLIMSTRDGGRIWEVLRPWVSSDLLAVSFSDRNNGWAVGRDGVVLKTSNVGTEWSRVNLRSAPDRIFTGRLSAVKFVDGNLGCISATDQLFCTADGGKSWTNSLVLGEILGFTQENGAMRAIARCPTDDLVSTDKGKTWSKFLNQDGESE